MLSMRICSCVLHVVSWCLIFVQTYMKISQAVFKLKSGHKYTTEIAIYNVQRVVTPNVDKQEL